MKRVSSLRQNVLRVVRIRVVSIKETFRREAIQAHQRGEDVKEFCICRLKEVAEASAALVERLTERLDQNHSDQDQANGILRAGGYCRCAARQMRRWGTGKIALGTVCAVIAFFANQEQFLVVMSLMMAMVSAALLTIVTVVGFHQFLEGYWEKDELIIDHLIMASGRSRSRQTRLTIPKSPFL